jgi:3-methyladenine DNA glycosylase AlkD
MPALTKPTVKDVLKELKGYGDAKTKKTYMSLGAKEPLFGVKAGDLKKIQKKLKKDHDIALELYATGNSDAMYLAGLIADENKMTKADIVKWVNAAYWSYLSEYTVPWIAAESPYGCELGLKWIKSKKETVAAAGWAALAWTSAVKPDAELDLAMYKKMLGQVEENIHQSPNRVRYVMNGYVIAVGSNIKSLTKAATATAKKIGKIEVDMGGTACKVPLATEYIQKVADRGTIGKKRKTARC